MAAGSSVVTANKALLAADGATLYEAAERNGVDLYFEAAVAGAIPLLRPLRESLAGDKVTKVLGIVNGTTNFMLTKMDEEGADYATVLAEAQALGFAEADPTADVEGHDAAAKAAILAELAFHTRVTLDDVYCEGISKVTAEDIRAAQQMGFVIKLLAVAELTDAGVIVRVHPTMLPRSHPLASVRGAFNAVFIEAESAGEVMFYGRGAGGAPTASAVLGDRRLGRPQPGERRPRPWREHLHEPAGAPHRRGHDPVLRQPRRDGPAGRAREHRLGLLDQRREHPGGAPGRARRRGRADRAHAPGQRRRPAHDGDAAEQPRHRAQGAGGHAGRGRSGSVAMAHVWRGLIEEYRDRLPVTDATPVISLREGGTPLVYACVLSELVGCEVWLKYDGANPTGSFKDRGMTMAISKAAEAGAKAVICASTGNTSASAAAYAAKAGMTCAVLVPEGKIAMGKLAQAIVHGARLLQVDGNFDDCLELARKLAVDYPVELVNSVNPARIEGQKTAAFEVVDQLGRAPDIHCLPVGNAGNITAYWKGYVEYAADGIASSRPRMWGFQAAGAAPLVSGEPVLHPETIATAIRIGNPASWHQAIDARDSSGGLIDSVTDDEILAAYHQVARDEALFCEPASAASVAGLLKMHAAGALDPGQVVVCTLTGNGLKDTQWALESAADPVVVPVDAGAVAHALGLA